MGNFLSISFMASVKECLHEAEITRASTRERRETTRCRHTLKLK
jgi:hypothetical protein